MAWCVRKGGRECRGVVCEEGREFVVCEEGREGGSVVV